MIEIPVKLKSAERIFKFKPMSIEQAIEWSSRVQARSTYRQSLVAAVDEILKLPVLERDEKQYLDAVDRIARIEVQIAEIMKNLAQFVIEPSKEELEGLMRTESAAVFGSFGEFLAKLFPTEEETKKS